MLTYEHMKKLLDEWNKTVVGMKKRDRKLGLCSCDNCFGDRCVASGVYNANLVQRYCLIRPNRLTDLGPLSWR